MAVAGDLDAALRELEGLVLARHPRCAFFFGDKEERMRQKTPPYVAWYIASGEPDEGTVPRTPVPKSVYQTVDDWVTIVARCAGLVDAGQLGPDPRRQQLAASTQVMLSVSLAVHGAHQGYVQDRGWQPANPEACSDSYLSIDFTFAIRAPRLSPPLAQVRATEAPSTVELT